MNKKAIWFIIGLMTAALIGVVLLQVYWIRWSIQLNQDRFDKDVYSVLNRVTEKLQNEEDRKEEVEMINMDETLKRELMKQLERGGFPDLSFETTIDGTLLIDSIVLGNSINNLYSRLSNFNDDCDCAECRSERNDRNERIANYWQFKEVNKMLNPEPIVERMNISRLDEFIRKELKNRGVNIPYQYGVYSDNEKSFVITNGFYVVKDSSPHSVAPGWRDLYNSEYRVDLFPMDVQSPGLLMIHFPAKASVIWGNAWVPLLASVFFTSIILISFAYTIQVIFRQKKLSEMKTDFINNMTHEFKTPIATINLALDSIKNPKIIDDKEKVKRYLQMIREENKRMHAQVENVLRISKLEKNELSISKERISLHDLIENAISHVELIVEDKQGHIETELMALKPYVLANETHFTNVFVNILDNAIKYSPEAPKIIVETENAGNNILVRIKDEGSGMSKAVTKRVFEKFYREHTGNIHNVKGHGLGLAYVKRIVEDHSGHISVISEKEKGSTFTIKLPLIS